MPLQKKREELYTRQQLQLLMYWARTFPAEHKTGGEGNLCKDSANGQNSIPLPYEPPGAVVSNILLPRPDIRSSFSWP